MSPRVGYVITDISMSLSFDGLNNVIREFKKKNQLFRQMLEKDPALILFVNSARTKAKLFSEEGTVIGYLSLGGRKLSAKSIDQIPETFGGSLEYSKATKRALTELFKEEEKAKEKLFEKTKLYA